MRLLPRDHRLRLVLAAGLWRVASESRARMSGPDGSAAPAARRPDRRGSGHAGCGLRAEVHHSVATLPIGPPARGLLVVAGAASRNLDASVRTPRAGMRAERAWPLAAPVIGAVAVVLSALTVVRPLDDASPWAAAAAAVLAILAGLLARRTRRRP